MNKTSSVSCCPILFLDYDGVILTMRMALAQGTSWSRSTPDPAVTMILQRCCKAGCKIVVSSSWRDHESSAKSKLIEAGLIEYLHEDWKTKEKPAEPAGSRPKEIADWLKRHPEVTRYRILDDDEWKWTADQNAAWIKCHPYDGMNAMGMKSLLEWAGVPLRITLAGKGER